MKNKIIVGVILLFVGVLINSCENKEALLPLATGFPAGCDTAGITYSSGTTNTIQGTINTYCALAGCHVRGTAGANYTTYYGLQSDATGGTSSLMWQHMFDNYLSQPMPKTPQSGWDSCMKYQFKAWLLKGAPL